MRTYRVRCVRVFVFSLLGCTSIGAGAGYAQTAVDSPVAKARAQHLRRGINLSEWFAQVYDAKGYTKEHFETWTTAEDIALIKAMGFDHVRLSINPEKFWKHNHADDIPAELLDPLDNAVKMILEQDLAVTLDIHPDGGFKEKLGKDDDFVEQFADFWRAFAKHYSSFPADKVTFEILNEPEMRDHYRWAGVQARLALAIREGAPQHTIIAEGARWADDDDMLWLDPLRDPNVIYNFHFYEPHIFTHQGATWGVNYWHDLKELPYPSTTENVRAAAAMVPNEEHRLQVMRYGAEHWNAARIDLDFAQVAEWAKRWNVPVICNEFGVYRHAAKPEDRAAWINDVRTLLEKNGIGWTMWDYNGGFGVVVKKDGKTAVDEVTVKALGLKGVGSR